jgi:starch-binding outer membrane protein, SusD/RagB family
MRIRIALPAFFLTLAAGCDDTLTVEPANEVPSGTAISDAASARSALAGAYDALQDDVDAEYRYYSGDFLFFGDLPSDNSTHTGTFDTFLAADQNRITADNLTIEAIWEVIYAAIGRTNGIIAKVPNVADLSDEERNEIIGEAHFLRALHYHNLVKLWGGVPLQLEPVETADDATNVTKASTDEVYAQVLSDLDQAETLMTSQGQTTKASRGAVFALRSRVLLYRQDWAGVISAADSAEGYGYSLAPQYSDLFTEQGSDTPEDIFKTAFTNTEANTIGYYYFSFNAGGRGEVARTSA